jgi:hypothetical protein
MEIDVAGMWRETSILGLLGIVVALATMMYAGVYAWRPTEARLMLIRPLSLATIFAALCSWNVGIANVLNGISATEALHSAATWRVIAKGTSETFVALFIAFGCLAISWLGVALGLRRSDIVAEANVTSAPARPDRSTSPQEPLAEAPSRQSPAS